MIRVVFAFVMMVVMTGCESCERNRITGASIIGDISRNETFIDGVPEPSPAARPWKMTVPNWQPFLGIHAFAWQQNVQQPYLELLCDAEAIKGVRVDLGTYTPLVAEWARTCNFSDTLVIFNNEYLRSDDVVSQFCASVSANPDVRFWEIGNEVKNFIQMDAEEYMPIFTALFTHAANHHPDLDLLAEAPIGAVGGVVHVRKMMELGLKRLAEHGIRTQDGSIRRLNLLAFHYYGNTGTFLHAMSELIQDMPPHVRIWVTETGTETNRHVEWVNDEIPRLKNMGRVDRVYWYVATSCDSYGLVRNPNHHCDDGPAGLSPLYRPLAGVE